MIFFLLYQATIEDCEQLHITNTAKATTSYGVPDPVTIASVTNTTDVTAECVVDWEHNGKISNTSNYKVRKHPAK